MKKKFWLRERLNPQTGTYWVLCGQITVKEAKAYEKTLYGDNVMHPFTTEAAYHAKIDELRKANATLYS
jgi:hypothetical protein